MSNVIAAFICIGWLIRVHRDFGVQSHAGGSDIQIHDSFANLSKITRAWA